MKKVEVIRTYYEENMNKGLPEYKVLGWESEEAQRLRFNSLIFSVDMAGKKILDVGCGMGNLLEYLNLKGIQVDYTGVDILKSMIEQAGRKGLNGTFYHADIFEKNIFQNNSFDIIYASGIFNLNLNNNRKFLSNALRLFMDLSKEAVVFNLLHHKSPDKEEPYYYFDPEEVKDIVEELPQRVKTMKIVENYLNNDFTVVCRK
ncbi:methyltransferase family protein [Anaerobacterium chartisolvens]|uniref:Methyltransferase family protein n=1 Tax=Anaerobacterium chartisolvens TaxID=1297424 RepID=A0A369BB74_9FIRM|nr:class I SAM-dependent methyltransferase [Anaerobacterium chartisolvens]RCX17848.1 methyltransferase family protein [Anaerobacterium chartisolvens]